MAPILVYPTIFTHHHGEYGDYYTVTAPSMPALATTGASLPEALDAAINAIAELIDKRPTYPTPSVGTDWVLGADQVLVKVPVDMAAWYQAQQPGVPVKKEKATVTLPSHLVQAAHDAGLDLSLVLTQALEQKLNE